MTESQDDSGRWPPESPFERGEPFDPDPDRPYQPAPAPAPFHDPDPMFEPAGGDGVGGNSLGYAVEDFEDGATQE